LSKIWTAVLVVSVILLANPGMCQHFDFDTTDVNASVLVRDLVLTGRHIEEGDELGVFTPEGLCAGATVINNPEQGIGLAAWGDDGLTPEIDGFREREEYNFRYWDDSEEAETDIEGIFLLEGSPTWQASDIVILDMEEGGRHYTPTPTGNRHHIICSGVTIFEGDNRFPPGDLDQIGIITPGGVPAGLIVWDADEEMAAGWAFGDDPETGEVVEGFVEGESFTFRFWSRDGGWDTLATAFIVDGDTCFVDQDTLYHNIVPHETTVELELRGSPAPRIPDTPASFVLKGIYPNPMNRAGWVSLVLPYPSVVRLELFDLCGRKVGVLFDRQLPGGERRVRIDPGGFASGEYVCRIIVSGQNRSMRLIFMK